MNNSDLEINDGKRYNLLEPTTKHKITGCLSQKLTLFLMVATVALVIIIIVVAVEVQKSKSSGPTPTPTFGPPHKYKVYIFGDDGGGDDTYTTYESYTLFEKQQPSDIKNLSNPSFKCFGGGRIGKEIYLLVETDKNAASSKLMSFCYNCSTEPTSLEAKANVTGAYIGAAGTVSGSKFYKCGGTSAIITSYCERFDPATSNWTKIAPMKVNRTEFNLVAVGDEYIYAIGGRGEPDFRVLTDVERYDVKSDKWELKFHLAEERHDHQSVTVDDRSIYVCGGVDAHGHAITSCEIYDISKDQWSSGPQLQVRFEDFGMAWIPPDIFAFGGMLNGTGTHNAVAYYNLGAEWKMTSRLEVPREFVCSIAIDEGLETFS